MDSADRGARSLVYGQHGRTGAASLVWGCVRAKTKLASLTIPDSVDVIAEHAFYGCSSLTRLTIPESLKRIGYGAFGGCGAVLEQQ